MQSVAASRLLGRQPATAKQEVNKNSQQQLSRQLAGSQQSAQITNAASSQADS
jgi:hypothetical protein